jgi:uncharacterized membrane protein YcjF (UPF0283 family)
MTEDQRRDDERRDFYKQGMWGFYGIVVGLIVGAWGNFWASITYDYIIKHDSSLAIVFCIATAVLIALIVPFVLLFIYCFVKYKPWRL